MRCHGDGPRQADQLKERSYCYCMPSKDQHSYELMVKECSSANLPSVGVLHDETQPVVGLEGVPQHLTSRNTFNLLHITVCCVDICIYIQHKKIYILYILYI